MRDIENGQFSLAVFWERRARRILPPLFLVILVILVLGYYISILPETYSKLGESVFAQSFFASNMYFMRKEGYFAAPEDTFPLLHTWSLAVEEQFYVLFPLFVLLFARSFLKLRWAIALLGAMSFLVSVFLANYNPGVGFSIPLLPDVWGYATNSSAAFYLLPSRAWELCLGVFLALSPKKGPGGGWTSEMLGVAGLAAILAAIFLYDDQVPFPGMAAVLPTLGAAAIIAANTQGRTWVGQVLSRGPAVWVGVLSYSLYLWHWPLFVFAKQAFWEPLGVWSMLGLTAGAFALSWLSFHYVETPIRRKRFLVGRPRVFTSSAVGLVMLGSFGFAIYLAEGVPGRAPESVQPFIAAANAIPENRDRCFKVSPKVIGEKGPCFLGDDSRKQSVDFVLWGDSHADAWRPGLEQIASKHGKSGAFFGEGGCVPVLGVHRDPVSVECQKKNQLAMDYIQEHDVSVVILAARWSYFIIGRPSGGKDSLIAEAGQPVTNPEDSQRALRQKLGEMVGKLAREGRKVWIVRQVPLMYNALGKRVNFQKLIQETAVKGDLVDVDGPTSSEHRSYHAEANQIIKSIAQKPNVEELDPSKVLCKNKSRCQFMDGKNILYRDDNHLSVFGSINISGIFDPVFTGRIRKAILGRERPGDSWEDY